MNPEIKQKWVAALRSGEYKQGKKALHRIRDGCDEFCCLGVLCDLYIKEHDTCNWLPHKDFKDNGIFILNGDFFSSGGVLPANVISWANLQSAAVGIRDGKEYSNLIKLNDGGVPFSRIADLIEKQL